MPDVNDAANDEPEIDETPDAATETEATAESGADSESTDPKERNRQGYEQRQMKRQLDALTRELDGYKRRDEETRKAKLTEEQRLKEENESIRQENERLKTERLQTKIAAEFKLPAALAARLIGSDEEALRADAADLAKLLPRTKVGTPTDPVRETGTQPRFKRSQLRDLAFFQANEAAIKAAYRDGRIDND